MQCQGWRAVLLRAKDCGACHHTEGGKQWGRGTCAAVAAWVRPQERLHARPSVLLAAPILLQSWHPGLVCWRRCWRRCCRRGGSRRRRRWRAAGQHPHAAVFCQGHGSAWPHVFKESQAAALVADAPGVVGIGFCGEHRGVGEERQAAEGRRGRPERGRWPALMVLGAACVHGLAVAQAGRLPLPSAAAGKHPAWFGAGVSGSTTSLQPPSHSMHSTAAQKHPPLTLVQARLRQHLPIGNLGAGRAGGEAQRLR